MAYAATSQAMSRCSDHQQLFIAGVQRDQLSPIDAMITQAQRRFAAPHQIGDLAARRRAKLQPHMGRVRRELTQRIDDMRVGERANQGERDCAFDASLQAAYRFAPIPERSQCRFGVRQEDAACFGQSCAASQALEQRCAKLVLDNLEAAADGWLRTMQPPRRPREAAKLGDCKECFDSVDIHRSAFLICSDRIMHWTMDSAKPKLVLAKSLNPGRRSKMRTQAEKAAAFRALHERPGAFIIPNPWEAGTARLLGGLGFEALATTSLGLANMLGRADSQVTRAEVIANCRVIAEATDLPVNADLENCFAHEPEPASETIKLAAEAGVVGGSIEDYTGDPANPIYDLDLAVARVRAAAQIAHALPVPFLLTARAENLIRGRTDMADTIRRLQAYQAAGADVLYAPGLRTLDEVRQVVRAVNRSFNVVTGWLDPDITLAQLSEAGAKRISVGGALSRLVLATFVKAAQAMQESGSFAWMREMIGMAELRKMFNSTSVS